MIEKPFLDEIAMAGPEHLDPAYVATYDRKAAFDPTEDLRELHTRGLRSASTLIDFGAGTGTFAVAAADMCKRVVAVEVSPVMIEAMRRKVADHGATNVECVQAGFLSYDHRGPPPGFVFTRNALHHLPDFWKGVALARIAALLQPGGVLRLRDLVFSFGLFEAEERIADWVAAEAAEDPAFGWTREELHAHVRNEHTTFAWLLEPMIERAGFEIETAKYARNGAYATYVCVKRS